MSNQQYFGGNTIKQLVSIGIDPKIIVIAQRDSTLRQCTIDEIVEIITDSTYLQKIRKYMWVCNECVYHNELIYTWCYCCKKPKNHPPRV